MHAYNLARNLISKGLEVFVITRQTDLPSPDCEYVGNILVTRIPPRGQLRGRGWKALGPILLFLARVSYLLLKNVGRYDVIMLSGLKVLPIPAVLVSMVARKKCLIRVESPIELQEEVTTESLRKMNLSRSSILLKLWRGIRNMLVRHADCVAAISLEIKQELIGIGVDPYKIRCIPNGVDTDKFCPVPKDEVLKMRQELSLPTDKIVFTFTGRLAVSKGVLVLIPVWRELMQKYGDIHLVLIGSGKGSHDSCERELRDYIEAHKLGQSVSITGEVDNVYEYLRASDVFVFPSEYEGFSLSLLEALACGLPTVATRVGAASELIEDHKNGILVNPNDRQGMQTEIEWLLNHRDVWVDMGRNARKSIIEECSIEAVAKKHLDIFMELQEK